MNRSSFETNEFHPFEKKKKDTSHLYPEREGDNRRLHKLQNNSRQCDWKGI